MDVSVSNNIVKMALPLFIPKATHFPCFLLNVHDMLLKFFLVLYSSLRLEELQLLATEAIEAAIKDKRIWHGHVKGEVGIGCQCCCSILCPL